MRRWRLSTQQKPVNDNAHLNGSNNHEAVCALSELKPFIALIASISGLGRSLEACLRFTQAREHRSCRCEQSLKRSFALW